MLSIHKHPTLEDASSELLAFALNPANWIVVEAHTRGPVPNAAYQRQVGNLRVWACIEITGSLDVFLRVAFLGQGLTPLSAADHLEHFLERRIPLMPNSEWQVAVDGRRWIHFVRRYAPPTLRS
jgi:hypothetical protein